MPGAAFHITARTHRREPWFGPDLCDAIVPMIADCQRRTDARLLAYVIMPNHLHLVVHQGREPLASIVQPLLRRIALRVQRAHRFTGYVFERRFRDRWCGSPEYLRNAIVYTHLNPVRAGLCDDPGAYAWSSHHVLCSPDRYAEQTAIAADLALGLFARRDGPPAGFTEDYREYVEWRIAADRQQALLLEGGGAGPPPFQPIALHGDRRWFEHFAGKPPADPTCPDPERPDLRDLALRTLAELAPDLAMDVILGPRGGRRAAAVRREITLRATALGYRNCQIARYLRISEASVSRFRSEVRRC